MANGVDNGFPEYRRLIMVKLEEQSADIRTIKDNQIGIKTEVASIKTQIKIQTTFYGMLGGALMALGGLLLQYLS